MASSVDASGNPIPTSAVLMAASKHIGFKCQSENLDFLRCKKKDPNPEKCLDKGREVTHCVLNLNQEINQETSGNKAGSLDYGSLTAPEVSDSQIMAINHRFNGQNYLQWSQTVLRYIHGKRKEKYINGTASQPAPNDPNFDTWFAENNQVMTWLCNSMIDDISENYLLAETAKEIWDAVRQTYSSLENTAALLHLKRQLRDLKQGNLTVTEYYNALMKIWQQQDLYDVHSWETVKDAQLHRKLIDEGRIYDFLLGLNDSFEEIRGRIMGIKPLLSLREVVNHVQFEESKKLLAQSCSSIQIENSALAARGPKDERRNSKWCNHCKKKGHIREECWKLHGKPPTNKQRPTPNINLTTTERRTEDNACLSFEEVQLFRQMLDKHNKSKSTPSVNLVQSGNSIIALNTVVTSKDTWIVDSRATDHMTGNKTLFHNLKLCNELFQVKVANGVFTKVEGIGKVILSNDLELKNVLFVSALTCNLIFVSKLTRSQSCRVTFNDDCCFFSGFKIEADDWDF